MSLTWSKTPKTGFVVTGLILDSRVNQCKFVSLLNSATLIMTLNNRQYFLYMHGYKNVAIKEHIKEEKQVSQPNRRDKGTYRKDEYSHMRTTKIQISMRICSLFI